MDITEKLGFAGLRSQTKVIVLLPFLSRPAARGSAEVLKIKLNQRLMRTKARDGGGGVGGGEVNT